jgi:hypothetical protein
MMGTSYPRRKRSFWPGQIFGDTNWKLFHYQESGKIDIPQGLIDADCYKMRRDQYWSLSVKAYSAKV